MPQNYLQFSEMIKSLHEVSDCGYTCCHKPHKASQPAWQAMNLLQQEHGEIGLHQFLLLNRLGSGNCGNVYLCKIKEPGFGFPCCLFAMKVVDKEALKMKSKKHRVDMEKEILKMLDHPFLPTLYAEFDVYHYSCLVMEYCPGGDLLNVLQRQPMLRLSIPSAKFYAAEVLVALEYLHEMGIIYRDLKPENVLLQEDGHIMLSDFDLSLKCDVAPKLLQRDISESVFADMGCHSCFSVQKKHKKNKKKTIVTSTAMPHVRIPTSSDHVEFWAEPVHVLSSSLVGTHEYMAPEVILGLGHGSAVDWWAFGVLLYELLHGKSPFSGENNERTIRNILEQPLMFPRTCSSNVEQYDDQEMEKARDLIRKLLKKNPKKRMGSLWGSVEIKKHEFFQGVNWALIRSAKPPEFPGEIQKLRNKDELNNSSHFDLF